MPFFQYSATDKSGKPIKGTLQAESSNAAREALMRAGMGAVNIRGDRIVAAPSSPNLVIQQPRTAVPPPVVRTAKGRDKDRLFLFTQLSAAFRAGLNPAQFFGELRTRCNPNFAGSIDELARTTGEGRPMSDIMARYPDLYPHHVVALTRAGEQGGFIPDAFEEIANQAESAHKFKRFFFWIWFVALNGLLSIPLVLVFTRAMLMAYDKIDKEGGGSMDMGAALGVIWRSFVEKLIWPWGPFIVLFYLACLGFKKYMETDRMQMVRHKLGLKYPVFGARARQENFTRFSWTMARLSRAGIPPARAWQLAAESVPNLAMRDLLSRGGAAWLEGRERLSDLIHRSGVFPEEYVPMVATAEITGDIPGAMDRLTAMSRGEFETATNYAKLRSGVWGCLGLFVTGGLVVAILAWFWYHELTDKVLSGFEDTPQVISL